MSLTFNDVLSKHDTQVPAHLESQAQVPVLTGPQRQGDVGVWPRRPLTDTERAAAKAVSAQGVSVVRGEAATGANAHILQALDGPIAYLPAPQTDDGSVQLGVLDVPEGSTAYLSHTEEHGAIGIGPGTYNLHGKREQADELRRVAD